MKELSFKLTRCLFIFWFQILLADQDLLRLEKEVLMFIGLDILVSLL